MSLNLTYNLVKILELRNMKLKNKFGTAATSDHVFIISIKIFLLSIKGYLFLQFTRQLINALYTTHLLCSQIMFYEQYAELMGLIQPLQALQIRTCKPDDQRINRTTSCIDIIRCDNSRAPHTYDNVIILVQNSVGIIIVQC